MTVVVDVAGSVSGVGRADVASGSLVWVALADRHDTGWWVVEDAPGVALSQREGAVVRAADGSVVWAGPVSAAGQLNMQPEPGDRVMPEWVPVVADSHRAARRAQAREAAAQTALRECHARLERIVDAAHEYADDRHLCEVFDEFMIQNGLRPRSHDYLCTVNVTIAVQVKAKSYCADAVEVTDDMVAEALRELPRGSLFDDVQGHDIQDVCQI